jgi:hypothetical protein
MKKEQNTGLMPRPRELVSGYLRRFPGWTPLRQAMAAVLGVTAEDIIDVEAAGDPIIYLDARTQHGEFRLRIQAFIDASRAPEYRGKTAFLKGLARVLGQEVLYDDGGSPAPTRWVLVRPDGARFEVFEDAMQEGPDLVLDRDIPRRRLPED